ncbi:MAG TPA: cytochrome P450 [Candidatus Binatia bacterium]|nr:cytochrome P450 [Candidatus Binatia bacterium]
MTASSASARFELRGGEKCRSPFASYAALRDHDPVHHVADGDYYVLTRFADVWAAAADPATFSSASGLTVNYGDVDALGMGSAMPMVFLDPPEHTKFRALVTRKLTTRKVSELEPEVRLLVRQRLDRLGEMGRADIVAELFQPLPSFVVAHYLGVPPADRALFGRWSEAIVQAAGTGDVMSAGDAFSELLGYFASLIDHRRTHPGDDIVSDLVQLGESTVTTARILGFAFTMVTGGNDTVTGMLAGSACLLTQNPQQRARLLAAPELIPSAVEELLRLTSPVQNLARTVTRDVELHGVTIPKGRKVLLCYAAANRDDREFGPTAEMLDVERKIVKILTLSYGTHYCIGAAAARLQSRVALEELLRRFPHFDVDVEAGVYAPGPYVRRHQSLPWSAS